MTNKHYTKEFKQNIVDKYHSGSKVVELAKEYNVSSSTIYRWVKEKSSQNNKTSSTHNFDFNEVAGAKSTILGMSVNLTKEYLTHTKPLSELISNSTINIPKIPKFDFPLSISKSLALKEFSAQQRLFKPPITLATIKHPTIPKSTLLNMPKTLANIGSYGQLRTLGSINRIDSKLFKSIQINRQKWLEPFSKSSFFSNIADLFKQIEKVDKYVLCNLPMYGWYMHFDFTVSTSVLCKHLQEENETEINDILIRYYIAIFDEYIEKLSERHENRKALFQQIKDAYYQKMYFLVIPTVLSQVDGICNDIFHKVFFIKDTRENSEYRYLPKVFPLLLEILENFGLASQFENQDSPIFAHESRLTNKVNILNRNRVIHGEDFNYGTQQNTLKAFSLLVCISELCSMAEDSEDIDDEQQESTG